MIFRKTAAAEAPSPRELGVVSMGHFGNYFLVHGWHGQLGEMIGTVLYQFSGIVKPVSPEFSHVRKRSDGRFEFVHLFWVNDGFKMEFGPDAPVVLSFRNEAGHPLVHDATIHEVWRHDCLPILEALKAIGDREIWTNRIVWEMVKRCGPDERMGFFKVALDKVGWHSLDKGFEAMLQATPGEDPHRETLDFQCLCISNMDVGYLPSDLRAKFMDLAQTLGVGDRDRKLVLDTVRQMARIDNELACDFAHAVINTLEFDREEMAIFLRPCFPQNSQWWLHHALDAEKLGPEQAADALNCAGTAAATQGQPSLARLSYEAALKIDPLAQSVAWNAGWFCVGQGDIDSAGAFFKKINRHYTQHSLSTCWPQVKGMPWPIVPMGTERFSLPEGVTNWPRITVVTPSFNQGGFIEETILSVLHQGYPNLQYIVVDGNSTDETDEVLERYREKFDHLIIESDKGQTEAINKGLRLADGDLVAWLNSDDMYAPGALHQAAIRWIESKADVIAGICAEHSGHHLRLLNKPGASDTDFNLPQLARIFAYWFQGHYFFQPEVFFTKAILDKAGLLDESLYYSMDYDLWMRFVREGAVLDVFDWPVALFRKHDNQKTANLIHSVEEQALVRDRYFTLKPDEMRMSRLHRSLAALRRKEALVVGIGSRMIEHDIFADAIPEIDGRFRPIISQDGDAGELAEADFVILIVSHGLEEIGRLRRLREAAPERLIVVWLLNHQQHVFEHHEIAKLADIVIPAHPSYAAYLRNDTAIQCEPVPPVGLRWSKSNARDWFGRFGRGTRSPVLHASVPAETGGQQDNRSFLSSVTKLLEPLKQAPLVEVRDESENKDMGAFERRCGHIASLILPMCHESPGEVFDALLAGQIPLVPLESTDLDLVIPPALQESLPVLRFSLSDPQSVVTALAKAVDHHQVHGAQGALRRHQHVLEHHTPASRLDSILRKIELIRP